MPDYKCPTQPALSIAPDSEQYGRKPMIEAAFKFIGGERLPFSGDMVDVTSPVVDASTGERALIGRVAQFNEDDARAAVEAAATAWDRGQGPWPQMSLADRIRAIEQYVENLKVIREQVVDCLMWEIAKSASDAAKEFDRTIEFIALVIKKLKTDPTVNAGFAKFTEISGVTCQVRLGPIGVMLGLAAFNYPLNEMYAMLIPALLMGNTAVLKLPATGGLVHLMTADAFASALPPGVINFVTGSGRKTMPPIMATGLVDVIGFIGGTNAMDRLIKGHPSPHRLTMFAQLAAKNIGMVLPDADLETAAEQCMLGATSYNGQRCTSIKLMMVHESIADDFVSKLAAKVNALKAGLPWDEGVKITPLPEAEKPAFLEELIADAVGKGATIVNAKEGGGTLRGSLMTPIILDNVTKEMRLFHEEQFAPVLPVSRYSEVREVLDAAKASWNGQQSAIFTTNPEKAAALIDALATQVGRVNINMQCGRSPDEVPFSGRRSSAMGTMSVTEALRAFSIETAVTYKAKDQHSVKIGNELHKHSKFLAPVE